MTAESKLSPAKTQEAKKKTQSIAKSKTRIKKPIPKESKDSVNVSPNSSQLIETTETKNEAVNLSQQIHSPQPLAKKISTILCIPAYNEEKEIGPLIIKSKRYVDQILVCDDASEDLMGQIAEGLGATVIRHETSLGRAAAIRTLFERSLELDPALILIMDVNPRYESSEIPKIVSPINSGETDIVFGMPQINRSETKDEDDLQSIFMAFSRKSLNAFISAPPEVIETHSRIVGVALGNDLNLKEVQIEIKKEAINESDLETPITKASESPTNIVQQRSNIGEIPNNEGGISQRFIRALSSKSILFFGVPGLVLLAIGILAGAYTLTTFLNSSYLSLPAAIIMLMGVVSGLFLCTTSVILAAFSRLKTIA
jgi:hypothetical protein